jgi:hypothetical protein
VTTNNPRFPRGLRIVEDDQPPCGDRHWLGISCEAEQGHTGRCEHYIDGGRYEWQKPGMPWGMIVLVRPEEGL